MEKMKGKENEWEAEKKVMGGRRKEKRRECQKRNREMNEGRERKKRSDKKKEDREKM